MTLIVDEFWRLWKMTDRGTSAEKVADFSNSEAAYEIRDMLANVKTLQDPDTVYEVRHFVIERKIYGSSAEFIRALAKEAQQQMETSLKQRLSSAELEFLRGATPAQWERLLKDQ